MLPLKESVRKLEWYELHDIRTPEEQERLFSSLITTHTKLLQQAFDNLGTIADRDIFLNYLKNINTSLRIDPVFIIFLSGLPYADFLYESKQEDLYAFLRKIMKTLDSFETDDVTNNPKNAKYYYDKLYREIQKYTHKNFDDSFSKRWELLPPDEITF